MNSPGLKITNFHYTNTVIPQGTLTEYPKWVHMAGFADEVAQDADHEARLLARSPGETTASAPAITPKPEEPAPAVLTGSNDEKEILLQIAKEKNIKVDARWNVDRLRSFIEKETEGQ